MNQEISNAYLDILKEELVPATGCTEPVAVAFAGAVCRRVLGDLPEIVNLTVSGNIIKNVKSVIVPHTDGRRGLHTAVSAGICYGNAEKELEVISQASEKQIKSIDKFLDTVEINIKESDADNPFDIQLSVYKGKNNAYVRIIGAHTNVVCVKKNNEVLFEKPFSNDVIHTPENRSFLNVKDIVTFADEIEIDKVYDILKRQIDYNTEISKAGMNGNYGASIGKILIRSYGNSVQNRAKAYAAAGSDARMNGCELPVVINSGSGNQGITASVPVIVYAKECNVSEEMLYRELIVSNLVTIHLKTGIGSLSAYCGATSAGAGAGAGICYLYGGHYDEISHTIVNALAINSGMLCDGAKASCAAKIASAVEAGLLGMQMYMHDRQFYGGDGLVAEDIENTIKAVSSVAREGMRETDKEIIKFMIRE